MDRRDFIVHLGWGLAAGWAMGRLSWPWAALAGAPERRLALLADAHLKSGDEGRPEALSLARAVAEIRALQPPPDLVLLAGDLAHRGRPDALDLGREILSGLPAPLLAVRGEGDGAFWGRRFGEGRFSHACRGVHLLGLDTAWRPSSRGPVFALGPEQRRWLAAELARLDSATPLIILSHAPLTPIFRPWQQWTGDAAEITPLLSRFHQVMCLHGHVHGAGIRDQGSGVRGQGLRVKGQIPFPWPTENRKPKTENLLHCGLPATAWPGPQALQGTPGARRPGLGPHGCGWTLAAVGPDHLTLTHRLWQI